MSFGQDHTDTVAYKTGVVRVGEIVKVSGTIVRYEYRNLSGRIMTSSIRTSKLDWYTIDGERNYLLPDFNPENMGYEDTLYFRTGEVRYARIDKETSLGFKYEFVNISGKISKTFTRKSLLNKVVVGNKDSSIAEDFISPSPIFVRYKE